MADVSLTFGNEPVEVLLKRLGEATTPTPGDMLYVLNRQKSRILDRTSRGLDLNEQRFEPYSRNGPFYYYSKGSTGSSLKSRKAFAGRVAKKTGGKRTTVGVKFPSYGAAKAAIRGISHVDLLGFQAPHMLQAIVARSGDGRYGSLGIYGPEADRAEGHNVGAGNLPKREWFGFSFKDEQATVVDFETLLGVRVKRVIE